LRVDAEYCARREVARDAARSTFPGVAIAPA
jgi:hypothetical protein